jgi:hypothetical protein
MLKEDLASRENPTFILGTQRSGTTLLTRILTAHPQLFIQNELPLHTIFLPSLSKAQIIANIERHFLHRYKKTIPDYLLSRKNQFWGLKDPQLTEHLDSLEKFLPHSKFVVIVRDPRGVVNSYMNNKWGLGTNAYSGAEHWNREVNAQLDFCNRFPEQTLLLKFEDLIDDLEGSLKQISLLLGIPYNKEMLNYYEKKFEYAPNKQNQNTTKAPDASFKDKWRKHLSERQINDIEYVTSQTIAALGYKMLTSANKPSLVRKIYYRLHQKLLGELQIQYQLKVAPKLKKGWP